MLLFLFAIFGDASMRGAIKGLELFAHGVFPALFPFCVCIGCLKRLGLFDARGDLGFFGLLRSFMLGAMAGNPTGSMLIGGADEQKSGMSAADRSVYCALFNLASPVFILGTLGSRFFAFKTPLPAILIMLCHYGSALILFCGYYAVSKRGFSKARNGANEAFERRAAILPHQWETGAVSVFPSALMDALTTMLKLCGTIVFFVSVTELLPPIPLLSAPIGSLLVGMLEMTNGLDMLAASGIAPRIALSIACFILSFGGICIFMQANAVSPVRAAAYLSAKLMHGICAALLCYLIFPLFSADISVMSASAERLVQRSVTALQIALLCIIASAAASLGAVLTAKRTKA